MTAPKTKTAFDSFLEDPENKKILLRNGISIRHFVRPKMDFYVVQSHQGHPLCLLEIGKDFSQASKNKDDSFLEKVPPFYLKLPGYRIAFQRGGSQENGAIVTFKVQKETPTRRFVGDLSPRRFINFLVSTISFYRREQRKEKSNDRT